MRDLARAFMERYQPVTRPAEGRWPSAVLILLYERDGVDHIIFQVRTQHVEHHKGEISLPGGGRDPEDETLLRTALRETHEEIGVDPTHVEVYGQLDDVETPPNFVITPFVGAITVVGRYDFVPASIEVATLLEVPVPALLSTDVRQWTVPPDRAPLPAFRYGEYLIRGATALIVAQFIDKLAAARRAGERPA